MAELLKGAPVAAAIGEQLAPRIAALTAAGHKPTLAIVRVGEREDDLFYERGAEKRFAGLEMDVRKFVLPADCTQEELLDVIAQVNADDTIDGCLMFRPLPKTLNEEQACEALDPAKDIDGITRGSLFGVLANRPVGFGPCTAEACIEIIDHYGIELSGTDVTVIGRSLVIGKPVSLMLQNRNATVTMCHTRTKDVASKTKAAQVVVVAAGHIGTLTADCVREGQTVIDVGTNWNDELQKYVGDSVFDEVEPIVERITPVPGGVGSVTTAVLAKHVVVAAERATA